MQTYKYLIFDLDDTLLDFQAAEKAALEKVMSTYQIPFTQENIQLYTKINLDLWKDLEAGIIQRDSIFKNRFPRFFEHFNLIADGLDAETLYRKLLANGHQTMNAAVQVITELKQRGYYILAGTNGNGHTQRIRLKESQLLPLFDDLFISEEIGYEKPNIQFFQTIFKKIKILN